MANGEEEEKVYVSEGLIDLDGHLDKLISLFEQLQLATVEACYPDWDLLNFVTGKAYFFGVVLKKHKKNNLPSQAPPPPPPAPAKPKISLTSLSKQRALNNANKRKLPDPQGQQDPFSDPEGRDFPTIPDYDDDAGGGCIEPPTYTTVNPECSPYSNAWVDEEPREDVLGLVYLARPEPFSPLHARELNVGIIIDEAYRGKGYAREALNIVLQKAFIEFKCHRVQAILPDHVARDSAICFFTQMRFNHEGTRRLAFLSPMEGMYKDVTYMSTLDVEWVTRERNAKRSGSVGNRPAPKSVWDELFSRHQREREELLNWEVGMLSSGKPVQPPRAQTPTQSDFRKMEVDDDGPDEDGLGSVEKGKRKQVDNDDDDDDDDAGWEESSVFDRLRFKSMPGEFSSSDSENESIISFKPRDLSSSESENERISLRPRDLLFPDSEKESDSEGGSVLGWDVVGPPDTESEAGSSVGFESDDSEMFVRK